MIYNPKFIIWSTLFIGLCFQITPWTSYTDLFKPNWLMIILIYWLVALPYRVSVGTAFFIGIILDLFMGSALGVHAFILSVIAYLALFKAQVIKNLALWQQSTIVFALSILYNLFLFIFEIIVYHTVFMSPLILLSSFADGLLWLPTYISLQQIRRYFGVD